MADLAAEYWEGRKAELRRLGLMCVFCENAIEQSRIDYAKRLNLTPPRYCWSCKKLREKPRKGQEHLKNYFNY